MGRKKDDDGEITDIIVTVETAYGHEQRHVVNLIAAAKDGMKKWLEEKESAYKWEGKDRCEEDAIILFEEAAKYWDDTFEEEKNILKVSLRRFSRMPCFPAAHCPNQLKIKIEKVV